MAKPHQIYWLAPTSMLASLMAGFIFAIGHHFFYSSLNASPAPSGHYNIAGLSLSKQQLNTTAGTAFAFLVKACLTTSVSIAFIQRFWQSLTSTSSKEGPILKHIDANYSALSKFWSLLNFQLLRRQPVLFCLAFISWLIPIAAIITPGSISVEMAEQQRMHAIPLPYLNFTSLNFIGSTGLLYPPNGKAETMETYDTGGPSGPLQQVVSSTFSAGGNILPISVSPLPNSSWTHEFDGPSLSCARMNASHGAKVLANIQSHTLCGQIQAYYAWEGGLPYASYGSNLGGAITPEDRQATISIVLLPMMPFFAGGTYGPRTNSTSPACALDFYNATGGGAYWGNPWWNPTMLECKAHVSHYTVGFEYANGNQNISVTSTGNASSDVTMIRRINYVSAPSSSSVANEQHCIMPIAPAKDVAWLTSRTTDTPCSTNADTIRALSYQSVVDAFYYMIMGTINGTSLSGTSSVMTTPLLYTKEFSALRNVEFGNMVDPGVQKSLQSIFANTAAANISGLDVLLKVSSDRELGPTIEELFRNVTVSLMSEKYFRSNMSLDEMPLTNVTTHTFSNVYVYSRLKLWLAYGLALLAAAFAAGTGWVAMVSNGASYSDSFSSVLRCALGAELDVDVKEGDMNASDPIPAYLGSAKFTLRHEGGEYRMQRRKSKDVVGMGFRTIHAHHRDIYSGGI